MSGDINSITSTCQKTAGPSSKKLEFKPELVPAADQNEIRNLADVANLLAIYQDLTEISVPLPAVAALMDMADKYSAGTSYDIAAVLITDALKKESYEGQEKQQVDAFLKKIEALKGKYRQLFDEANNLHVFNIEKRYKEIEKAKTGPLHKRALEAVRTLIEEINARKLKAKFKTGDENWVDNLKADDIHQLIAGKCKAGFVEPPKPQPKPEKAPEKKKLPFFQYSLRLGTGYGLMPAGQEHRELIADQERGILMQSSASGKLNLSEKLALQIDYNFSAPYDVQYGDDLVSNNDFGRISLISLPLEKLDLFAQVGWRYHRNDYPGENTPDINALVESIRINYHLNDKLSINFDQHLLAGWTNESFPAQESDFHLIRALGEAGVSYKFGRAIPFIGAIGGYGEDGALYGGYAGTGLEFGEHEADLRLQYINDLGLGAVGRYFYNQEKWGVGANLSYQNFDFSDRHQFSAGLAARVAVAKLFGRVIELQPFVNVGYADNVDSALNVNFGLMFMFGSLRPAKPSGLKPYSIESLPEER